MYVGRPSKWGNPYSHHAGKFVKYRVRTREEAVAAYRRWLAETAEGSRIAAQAREELRGKDLVCWCAPEACHADVLLEIANAV